MALTKLEENLNKDKRKSEHSLVSDLIEIEDVIQVQQV